MDFFHTNLANYVAENTFFFVSCTHPKPKIILSNTGISTYNCIVKHENNHQLTLKKWKKQ